MKKLPASFYQRKDVLLVAKELIGKVMVTNWNGAVTAGRIVECEAYDGIVDKASHAFGGRRTARNETMFAEAGVAYVYICYGIHHLFNVITNEKNVPHAILIRALDPVSGVKTMMKRRKKKQMDYSITKGPGSLSVAMGINARHDNFSLQSNQLYIADDGYVIKNKNIAASPRIGVDSSGVAANYPYRFFLKGNPFVSGKPK